MKNTCYTYINKSVFILILTLHFISVYGQNNALILNGAFISVSSGTWANPVYLVVNNGQPAAILRNSGHIISEAEGNYVQWNTADVTATTNYVFPFGYAASDDLPLTLNKNSVGVGAGHINNTSAIVASTWGTPASNINWANSVSNMIGPAGANEFNSVVDRWWQLQSGTNVDATFDVSYRGSENTTTFSPTGLFGGQHWNFPSSQWLPPNGSGTGVVAGVGIVNNITLVPHGIASSSPYILSSTGAPLPIELISFTAICDGNKIHVNWKDATETNVMSIELQKSTDLSSWETIYTASPSNSSSVTNYDYEYSEFSKSIVYFRLISNNYDGGADISAVIYTQPCSSNENLVNLFYYNSMLNFHTLFSENAIVNYSLHDLHGRKITEGEFIAAEGDQLLSIPLEKLSFAIYILHAESNGKTYNQKILISEK